MQIVVRLFATLRQQAGWKEQRFEVPVGATVADILAVTSAHAPALNLNQRTLYAAVNMEYARPDRVLVEGDEVAFFPPVSGGVG
jgi:molybdopterin converting factor subunit 1